MCPKDSLKDACAYDTTNGESTFTSTPSLTPSEELGAKNEDGDVQRLIDRVKHVTMLNDQWQKYDTERENYVRGLNASMERMKIQLEHLTKELSKINGLYNETERRRRNNEIKLRDQQETINDFSPMMEELEEKQTENIRLKKRISELEDENRVLKKQMKKNRPSSERMELLQQQLEVCIEDFRKEKREKESFRTEAADLKHKLSEAEKVIKCYQQKVSDIRAIQFPTMSNYPINSGSPEPKRSSPSRFTTSPSRPTTVQSNYRVQDNNKYKCNNFEIRGEDFPDLPTDIQSDGAINIQHSATVPQSPKPTVARTCPLPNTIPARPISDLSLSCPRSATIENGSTWTDEIVDDFHIKLVPR